jgi:hypothetical protein
MTTRALTLAGSAVALCGLALGATLWSSRWPALAVEATLRLCG